MKILLANNTLHHFAGSETHLYTLALEFKRLGHEVEAFSSIHGPMAVKLQERGIPCLSERDLIPERKYDVIFSNHKFPTWTVQQKYPNTPVIFTLHGIIGGPETPVEGCHKYVAVSEETQALFKGRYGIDSTIIRNPIDIDRFKNREPIRNKINNVLISSSYWNDSSDIGKVLINAFKEIGATVHGVGTTFGGQKWEMDTIYNQFDLVVTLGRGVLEANACGRPALIYGQWGVDGILTPESYSQLRRCNFSGRRYADVLDVGHVLELLKGYHQDFDMRHTIIEHHDVKKIAQHYLSLIK